MTPLLTPKFVSSHGIRPTIAPWLLLPGAAANSTDATAEEPYYYPLAPRNLSVNMRVAF